MIDGIGAMHLQMAHRQEQFHTPQEMEPIIFTIGYHHLPIMAAINFISFLMEEEVVVEDLKEVEVEQVVWLF